VVNNGRKDKKTFELESGFQQYALGKMERANAGNL
jgi:hypothetical protein